jgi:hypothetical protein
MSLDDLKDEHLQKALQHAPDSDVAPSELLRKTVLDYADKAVKMRHAVPSDSWFTRFITAFNHWQIPRWQLTGMGSLAASLLVVVMILYENPNDPMQVATAPSEAKSEARQSEVAPQAEAVPEPKLAQNELARASDELAKQTTEQSPPAAAAPATATTSAPEAASAEMALSKAQDKVIAKAKAAKQEALPSTPQAAAIEAPADKAASAPQAASVQDAEKDTGSVRLKERAVIAEVAPPAPVVAAPAPVAEPAPAMAEASADAASEQTVSAAPANKAMKKMKDAAQAEAKADVSSASVGSATLDDKRRTTKRVGDDPLADTIVQKGGATMANQDIQAGKLRLLEVADYYKGKPSDCDEPFIAGFEDRVDAQTTYKIEALYVCVATQALAKEVALYNQTMREWHLKH